ncbi:MAG TPA: YDG domain-containing protein, partial [Caulobacteraceae bacterium]
MRRRPAYGAARSISTSFQQDQGLHGLTQRHIGRSFRRTVLVGASAVALGFGAQAATPTPTMPTGGHFAAGTGIIGPAIGGSLQINQSSSRGIIDWSSFSIGAGGHVSINNGTGATLSRVTGGQTSFIDGSLTATGSLYFVNPQGVVIGQGGKIIGGGTIVLSTRDIQNQLFMAGGGLVASGASPGVITNEGRIVAQQGDVVLIASSVDNAGDIEAPKGAADLVAANTVLLAPVGTSGGIYVAPDSSATGDVTESGKIAAASADLTAAGGNVYTLAGNRGGLIEAQGVTTQDGQVWLTAPNGTVSVSGQVSAKAANGSGGQIIVDGKSVAIQSGATLSATGTQGGQILVGVDAPGTDLAQTTTIADGASILAGGPQGGGHIETSGHNLTLGNALIEAGPGGTWLTDPTDLTIGSAAASAIETSLNAGTSVTEQTTATSFVDPSGAATTTAGAGDITVASGISWTGTGTLTLQAFNNVNINAAISGPNGGFTANAGAAVTVSAAVSAKSVVMTAAAGNLTLASGASVSGTNGVTLQTAQNFVNSGNATVTSSAGQWLIWSTTPTSNTLGGLTPNFIQYDATYGSTTVAQSTGNGLLYSAAPTLTLSSLTGTTSKVYDGTDTATLTSSNVTVSGLLGGDTASISGVYAGSNAGTGLTVTTTGVSVTNGSATVYGYAVSNPTVSGSIGIITPKQLSASIIGDPTKVYDQTTTATLTSANYSITGFIGSQGATVNQPSSVSYAGSSAGSQTVNATFSPTNFVANSGTNLSNYTLPTSATGAGTISQAPLIITGVLASSKVYDQTTSDTLNISGIGTYGLLSGDTANLISSGATGTFSQANVGSNLAVTVGGFSLTGAQAADYSLVLPTGLTASITPAHLTLSGVTAANKPYDATTTATITTPAGALQGVYDGDNVTLVASGVTGTFASPNVGDGITVTVGGYSLTGTSASNYSLSQPTGITANITPLTLSASITANPTKMYDGTDNAFVTSEGYSLSGFVAGQGATVIQAAQLAYLTANAGTQSVTATLATSDFTPTGSTLLSNYILPTTASGTGTITPAPLTIIIVGNPTKTYDATTAATLTSSNFSISGFLTGQGATVNQTVGTYASANAGIETVTANLSGELTPTGSTILSNYTIPSAVSGAGLINQAPLTVGVGGSPPYNLNGSIVANPTKVYDGSTTITTLTNANFSFDGFLGSDGATINQTTGTFGSANAGIEPLMVSLTSANYVATGSTNLNNYVLPTVVFGQGTITAKTITASIIGTPTKVYDGSTLSVLSASNIQFNGFVGSDGVTLSSSVAGTYASASAGSETVSTNLIPTDLPAKSGTILSNYVLPTSASGAGLITQAPLLITGVVANNKTYD